MEHFDGWNFVILSRAVEAFLIISSVLMMTRLNIPLGLVEHLDRVQTFEDLIGTAECYEKVLVGTPGGLMDWEHHPATLSTWNAKAHGWSHEWTPGGETVCGGSYYAGIGECIARRLGRERGLLPQKGADVDVLILFKSGCSRNITNFAAVVAAVENRGFRYQLWAMERHTPRENALRMLATDILITPEGQELYWMPLLPKGALVIVFLTDKENFHAGRCMNVWDGAGIRLKVVESLRLFEYRKGPDSREVTDPACEYHPTHAFRMEVDIEKLEQHLEEELMKFVRKEGVPVHTSFIERTPQNAFGTISANFFCTEIERRLFHADSLKQGSLNTVHHSALWRDTCRSHAALAASDCSAHAAFAAASDCSATESARAYTCYSKKQVQRAVPLWL